MKGGFQQLEDTLKEEYTIRANIAADYITHDWGGLQGGR